MLFASSFLTNYRALWASYCCALTQSSAQILTTHLQSRTSSQDFQIELLSYVKLLRWLILDLQEDHTHRKVVWIDWRSSWIHHCWIQMSYAFSQRLYRLVKSFHHWYEFLLLNLNFMQSCAFLNLLFLNIFSLIHLLSALIMSVQISTLSNLFVQRLYIFDTRLHWSILFSDVKHEAYILWHSLKKNQQKRNMSKSLMHDLHAFILLWNSLTWLCKIMLWEIYFCFQFCTD